MSEARSEAGTGPRPIAEAVSEAVAEAVAEAAE